MKLFYLKEQVWKANLDLIEHQLVTLTWGNVSGFDQESALVVIKPSGISYEGLQPQDMVVVDLEGNKVDGQLNPSSDTPTHLELYKAFTHLGGIAHTHSTYATMFAQAHRSIPCLGTTHADHFNGEIPLTRLISEDEVAENYERNTGKVIVERFKDINPLEMPAVLLPGHGAFTWGKTPAEAVLNSVALDYVAHLALGTSQLNPKGPDFPDYLLNKHYQRKHGPKAYYGQKHKGEKNG